MNDILYYFAKHSCNNCFCNFDDDYVCSKLTESDIVKSRIECIVYSGYDCWEGNKDND